MLALEKYPDAVGYLVLNEDKAIVSSGGELENSEHVAEVFSIIIHLSDKLGRDETPYSQLSVTFDDCSYTVSVSNRKTYIVKKRFTAPPIPSPKEEIAHPTITS